MKLSKNFLELLKNFSTINSGIVFKPGNTLRTMNGLKTILAQAEIEETFFQEFGIYDLNKLLALLSLNKDSPELEVEESSLVIPGLGGKGKIRHRFTDLSMITVPKEGTISTKNVEVQFTLQKEVLDWIWSVSSILKCPQTVIQGEAGEDMTINAMDINGKIVDSAAVTLETAAKKNFRAVINNDNLKVLAGAYDMKITRGCAHFSSKTRELQYWIAIENATSKFEE